VSGREKDIENLALPHQLAILRRQIDKPRMTGTDRAFLAALLHRLPRPRRREPRRLAQRPHFAAGTRSHAPLPDCQPLCLILAAPLLPVPFRRAQ
jgi:hypothetical protein